jgi:hypothetical protein
MGRLAFKLARRGDVVDRGFQRVGLSACRKVVSARAAQELHESPYRRGMVADIACLAERHDRRTKIDLRFVAAAKRKSRLHDRNLKNRRRALVAARAMVSARIAIAHQRRRVIALCFFHLASGGIGERNRVQIAGGAGRVAAARNESLRVV